MVGVKKLNEMRMNPCRGVPASSAGQAVNNFSIVKIEGYAVLRDET